MTFDGCIIRLVKTADGHSVVCPKCLGRTFKMSCIQSMDQKRIWECEACGYDAPEDQLVDKTPDGCLTVDEGG